MRAARTGLPTTAIAAAASLGMVVGAAAGCRAS